MSTLFKQSQRFSIRKHTVGVASVLLGTAILVGAQSVSANEIEPWQPQNMWLPPSTASEFTSSFPQASSSSVSDGVHSAVTPDSLAQASTIAHDNPVQGSLLGGGAVTATVRSFPVTEHLEPAIALENKEVILAPSPVAKESLDPTLEIAEPSNIESETGVTSRTFFRNAVQNTGTLASSGTYQFSARAGIKAEPKISSPDLAAYSAGQSVNYDRLIEGDGHQWISYIAYSGSRRYIAVKALPKPVQPVVPVAPKAYISANLTADGVSLSAFSNQIKDKSTISYDVWSEEKGQDDLKTYAADASGRALAAYGNHKHYGVYHIRAYSSESGGTASIGSQTITIAPPAVTSDVAKINETTFEVTVTNVPPYMHTIKIPVWSDNKGQDDLKWYTATKHNETTYKLRVNTDNHKKDTGRYHAAIYGKSKLEENRTIRLGTTAGFTVASASKSTSLTNKIDSSIPSSGSYTFTSRASVKDEPKVSAPERAFYTAGQSVYYDRQLTADGQQWISYTNFSGGRSYIAISSLVATQKPVSVPAPSKSPSQSTPVAKPSITIPSSGSYTFTERASVKGEPKQSAPELAFYNAGQSVNYDSKLTADGYQWISYTNYSGSRSYIPIQALSTTSTASNPGSSLTTLPTAQVPAKPSTLQLTSPNARPLYQANTYPYGQCTWGAKQTANWVNNWWGNAGDWIGSAQRDGFTVGDTPVVGAVAVWPNTAPKPGGGYYGHVGVVTHVASATSIRIVESNVNNDFTLKDYRGYFNPTGAMGGVVKYIYPPSR